MYVIKSDSLSEMLEVCSMLLKGGVHFSAYTQTFTVELTGGC